MNFGRLSKGFLIEWEVGVVAPIGRAEAVCRAVRLIMEFGDGLGVKITAAKRAKALVVLVECARDPRPGLVGENNHK